MKYLVLLFYFTALNAFADNLNTLSVNSALADKSFSTLISLQPSLTAVLPTIDIDFSLDVGRFRNEVNYNSAVEDFSIEKNLFSAALDMTWKEILTIGAAGSTESINQNEVRTKGFTSKIRVRVYDFSVRASLNDRYIRQGEDYIVLNTNLKDRLTLRSTKKTLALSYYGFKTFSFSITHSKYEYDSDPTQANLLLSSQPLLKNHGASFLSQIYSLIDHETAFDFVYSFTDNLDIEMMLGETVDFLEPKIKSNEFRLGTTYYFKIFSLGGGVTGVKPADVDETFFSGDLTLSYEF